MVLAGLASPSHPALFARPSGLRWGWNISFGLFLAFDQLVRGAIFILSVDVDNLGYSLVAYRWALLSGGHGCFSMDGGSVAAILVVEPAGAACHCLLYSLGFIIAVSWRPRRILGAPIWVAWLAARRRWLRRAHRRILLVPRWPGCSCKKVCLCVIHICNIAALSFGHHVLICWSDVLVVCART